jgi:hypothetical protein
MSEHEVNVNRNGRVYPDDVMRRAIEDAQERVKAGRMIGQVGNTGADGKVHLNRASHVVRELKMHRDGTVIAKLEFVDSPAGRDALAMLKADLPVSGTMVGRGSRDEHGVVQEMKLGSVDVVFDAFQWPRSAVDQLADLADEDD